MVERGLVRLPVDARCQAGNDRDAEARKIGTDALHGLQAKKRAFPRPHNGHGRIFQQAHVAAEIQQNGRIGDFLQPGWKARVEPGDEPQVRGARGAVFGLGIGPPRLLHEDIGAVAGQHLARGPVARIGNSFESAFVGGKDAPPGARPQARGVPQGQAGEEFLGGVQAHRRPLLPVNGA
jgi:hypothetical protein